MKNASLSLNGSHPENIDGKVQPNITQTSEEEKCALEAATSQKGVNPAQIFNILYILVLNYLTPIHRRGSLILPPSPPKSTLNPIPDPINTKTNLLSKKIKWDLEEATAYKEITPVRKKSSSSRQLQ